MTLNTLFAATLLAIATTATPSVADDIAMPDNCIVKASSIETRLATPRLARIHSKARNYSPRLTDKIELSSAAALPWRLADAGAWWDARTPAVCTPCER
jgi:hypothetical protein